MDWKEILKEKYKNFCTPIRINKDEEYQRELFHKFELLIDILKNDESNIVTEVQNYVEKISDTIRLYYSGYTSDAQKMVDEMVDEVCSNSEFAISNIDNSISFGGGPNNEGMPRVNFFRARCNDRITDYNHKEMLHIPFNQRSKVGSARFSIPGLPCLYLGNTSYVCWLELGKPAVHQFNVSPVLLDNSQQIFNLTINIYTILDYIEVEGCNEEHYLELLKLLILGMATSFKVEEKNRTFKSEYMISQMIMLSCMKKGISGIAYYSKQVDNDLFARNVAVNLALFAKYEGEDELSKICNHLEIADSFNYSMYKQLLPPQKYRRARLRVDDAYGIKNIGNFARQYPYRETVFYEFDQYLWAELKLKKVII